MYGGAKYPKIFSTGVQNLGGTKYPVTPDGCHKRTYIEDSIKMLHYFHTLNQK